jgi:hypothetical protein
MTDEKKAKIEALSKTLYEARIKKGVCASVTIYGASPEEGIRAEQAFQLAEAEYQEALAAVNAAQRAEAVAPNVEGRDFYELCQAYRHAPDGIPRHPSLPNAVVAFASLKEYLKTGKLPWPSYESDAGPASDK